MNLNLRIRLSLLMFLEFFVWGAWFVTMGTYLARTLGASDVENGMAYGTQSLGAIIAPFIVGLIADRFLQLKKSWEFFTSLVPDFFFTSHNRLLFRVFIR